MTKTLTCRELGGVCDERFSGNSLGEVMMVAGPHMMSDDEHKASIMSLESRTGENKEQWTARMQKEFDARPEDA